MGRMFSPLRYPGGKTSMLPLMSQIIRENDLSRAAYAEPYAGGCGLALGLLFQGIVSDIHINDIDPAVWAFWDSVLNRTDELTDLVMRCDLTIEEWKRQRDIFAEGDGGDKLRLGFSAFYLNRTNRSGIIKGAGVIGGLKQTGNYKLDCRFNRPDLARRIKRIAKYKRRIHLTQMDALDFLDHSDRTLPQRSMLCIDPPYFNKGSSLYTSFYRPNDHAELASKITKLRRPWIVTYDNTPEIRSLYESEDCFSFDVNYSVQTKRTATELLIASPQIELSSEMEARRVS